MAYTKFVQRGSREEFDTPRFTPGTEVDNSKSPINLPADTMDQDNDVLSPDVDTISADRAEPDENKDSDDIRIQDGETETPASSSTFNTVEDDASVDAGKESGLTTQTAASDTADTTDRIPPTLIELLDNLCLIAPSAFRLATDKPLPGSQPFITFHPSYLRKINGDIISTLDDTMRITTSNSTSFFTSPSHESWIDAVRDFYKQIATEKGAPSLYLLLILRFHIALFDAFNAAASSFANQVKPQGPNHTLNEGGENENEIKQDLSTSEAPADDTKPTDDSRHDEQTETFTRKTENHNDATAEDAASLLDSGDTTPLPSLVSTLVTQLNDISDKDTAEMIDLFKSHAPGAEKFTQSLEDVFLLPLQLLLQNSDAENAMESASNGVREVILALEAQRQQPVVDEMEPKKPLVAEAESLEESIQGESSHADPSDSAEVTIQMNTSPTQGGTESGPGKRNRKKKKKKKRKGPAGNGHATGKDSAIQDKPNIVESEKKDGTQARSLNQSDVDITLAQAKEAVENCAAVLETSTPPISPAKENVVATTALTIDVEPSIAPPLEKETETIPESVMDNTAKAAVAPVAQSAAANDEKEKESRASEEASNEDDQSAWETVEVRSRGNRKKSTDRNTQGRFGSHHGHNSSGQNGSKKSKAPRTKDSRKRNANRKMVREILAGVLDTVDEEVRKRRQAVREVPRFSGSKWPAASARNQSRGFGAVQTATEDTRKSGATMRDVLIGRQPNGAAAKGATATTPSLTKRPTSDRSRAKPGTGRFNFDNKRSRDKNDRASQLLGAKVGGTPTADQNTATTVPETVSANSAVVETTNPRTAPPRGNVVARSDSSSGESAEGAKEKRTTQESTKAASPSPPLPTLLSPGNNNSASSSVASSLEAPHAVHNVNHHSSFLGSENDVGYHLLHVCDRLSRDIQIFMKRRDHALEVRRRERGLVLDALQDSLSAIWPGMCSVEMYGSCATELDLPSSDLDVVVCGLDRPVESVPGSQTSTGDILQPAVADAGAESSKPMIRRSDSTGGPSESQQHVQNGRAPHHAQMPMMYGHLSLNADRVVRLAMELEMQPWAVHVKAIPTASVPVIKILADPARLNGAVRTETGEWLVPQTAGGQSNAVDSAGKLEAPSGNKPSISGFHGSQSPPPWRGADVVNGLMKVDITFEGPEHGGIGSTKFSSRVVQEFCKETGLPADQTPAVQVLMVLKELLAQRRLNEPFSGGLSSYALLLLVISVVRERAIIKEELERVERQRRIVAAGGGNSSLRANHAEFIPQGKNHGNQSAGNRKDKKEEGGHAEEQANARATDPTTKKLPSAPPQTEDPSQSNVSKLKESPKNGGSSAKASLVQKTTNTSNEAGRQDAEKETNDAEKKPTSGVKPSSWASIAKKSAAGSSDRKASQDAVKSSNQEKKTQQPTKPKVSSFADAVAKGSQSTSNATAAAVVQGKKTAPEEKKNRAKKADPKPTNPQTPAGTRPQGPSGQSEVASAAAVAPSTPSAGQAAPSPQRQSTASLAQDTGTTAPSPSFPQGFHDVTEVLCSGETTPGKLLMNFLLFYGQHFDSQSTAIDYSSTHQRDGNNNGYSHLSPYLQRRSAGSYDPMTGMLTVDPIVVYDPLEGAENNNVARSCFAWSSIRWVFAQSYMTLSSVVEMSASNTSGQSGVSSGKTLPQGKDSAGNAYKAAGAEAYSRPYIHDDSGNVIVDPSSSLLELLLAF